MVERITNGVTGWIVKGLLMILASGIGAAFGSWGSYQRERALMAYRMEQAEKELREVKGMVSDHDKRLLVLETLQGIRAD